MSTRCTHASAYEIFFGFFSAHMSRGSLRRHVYDSMPSPKIVERRKKELLVAAWCMVEEDEGETRKLIFHRPEPRSLNDFELENAEKCRRIDEVNHRGDVRLCGEHENWSTCCPFPSFAPLLACLQCRTQIQLNLLNCTSDTIEPCLSHRPPPSRCTLTHTRL